MGFGTWVRQTGRMVRRPRHRLLRWGTIVLVVVGLAVALYPPAHFWGPRPYRHPDGLFGVTRGDFEDDILPHYQVSLPCDVDGLRYSNAEDMTGPMGELYLHFATSQGCLERILDGWLAVPAEPPTMAPSDPEFPLPAATLPDTLGWRFDAPSYQVYRRMGDLVTGDVVAVRDGKRLSVYLLARYAYFQQSTVRNVDGYLSVYAVSRQALLAVVGSDSINVARLHLHAPATAGRLAQLLDGVMTAR